eukprot:gene10091-10159_t
MINVPYKGPQDLPDVIPLFPLGGALLLPRGQLPLNVFEPRYMAMVDDVIRGHRLIGMIQPQTERDGAGLYATGCVGRVTQFQETGDGRYGLTLCGVARFHLREEVNIGTAYRQGQVDYTDFIHDFTEPSDDELVDRDGVLRALRQFAKANRLRIDWKDINDAPNEALINALAMMSPFGIKEKQALLEAGDLKTRADVLIAITEMDLARGATPHATMQ